MGIRSVQGRQENRTDVGDNSILLFDCYHAQNLRFCRLQSDRSDSVSFEGLKMSRFFDFVCELFIAEFDADDAASLSLTASLQDIDTISTWLV